MDLDPTPPDRRPPDDPPTAGPESNAEARNGREHTEVELKLFARDGRSPDHGAIERAARQLGILLEDPQTATQVDTYLDDAALRLGRAGAGLRVRRKADRGVLTLKIRRAPGPDDAHRRSEFEFPWPDGLPGTAEALPGEIRKRVEPVVFDEPLRAFVELRTDRTRWIARSGEGRAEICCDHVRVGESGHPSAHEFHEVEIEQLAGRDLQPWIELAEILKSSMGFETSRVDKLQRALQAGRVDLAPLKPPALHPGLTLREAALRVFEGQLRRIQKHEVKARIRDGARPIHKLRVACRRMRAAMQTFEPAFPPGELAPWAKTIKRTARSFDEARDLDVMLESLAALRGQLPTNLHAAHDATLLQLGARRRKTVREARSSLADPKRVARLGAFQRWVEGPARTPRLDLTPPLEETARRLLTDSLDEVVERAGRLTPHSEAQQVHDLRLAMKRLRYTGECFATAFGDGLQALLTHCTEMQTVLGEFNDAEVAIARLHALGSQPPAESEDGTDARERLLVIGAWLLIQERRRKEARARIDGAWQRFDPAAMQPALAEALRGR